MIELMPESADNVVGIRFVGKLSPSDYRDVLDRHIEALLQQFATLRVLILVDKSFDGWTLSAAWANTVFDLKHRGDFEKIAMVGAPRWEQWCVQKPASWLMRGELRTYPRDRLDEAWQWLHA
ncbi:STAS/SEC14 domain-containing protein [Mycobacterium sp. NPDC051198]